jgi:ParB-like nuclease family protein
MSAAVSGSFSLVSDTVVLVPIAGLKTYEKPDAIGIEKITQSVADTGLLIDPIVVDRRRQLLIDGHHRCAALNHLGIDRIAAFDTDYFSPSVEVRGWVRVSNVPREEIKRAFASSREETGKWKVSAVDDNEQTIATRQFAHHFGATDFVQRLCDHLDSEGWRVNLEVPGAQSSTCSKSPVRFFVTPVVGKREVWEAVKNGTRFPNEVNRHLIHGRPLALGIPVERLREQDQLTEWLRERLGSPERTVARSGGTYVDGRFYEETVVVPAETR